MKPLCSFATDRHTYYANIQSIALKVFYKSIEKVDMSIQAQKLNIT